MATPFSSAKDSGFYRADAVVERSYPTLTLTRVERVRTPGEGDEVAVWKVGAVGEARDGVDCNTSALEHQARRMKLFGEVPGTIVVPITEERTDQGFYGYRMPHVDAPTLAERVTASPSEAVGWVPAVLDASWTGFWSQAPEGWPQQDAAAAPGFVTRMYLDRSVARLARMQAALPAIEQRFPVVHELLSADGFRLGHRWIPSVETSLGKLRTNDAFWAALQPRVFGPGHGDFASMNILTPAGQPPVLVDLHGHVPPEDLNPETDLARLAWSMEVAQWVRDGTTPTVFPDASGGYRFDEPAGMREHGEGLSAVCSSWAAAHPAFAQGRSFPDFARRHAALSALHSLWDVPNRLVLGQVLGAAAFYVHAARGLAQLTGVAAGS